MRGASRIKELGFLRQPNLPRWAVKKKCKVFRQRGSKGGRRKSVRRNKDCAVCGLNFSAAFEGVQARKNVMADICQFFFVKLKLLDCSLGYFL